MTDAFVHRPVMVDEIVAAFGSVPGGVVLDATLGGGGHTEALLDSRDDLMVLGIDRDPAALAAATARLERFGSRFRAVHARFDDLHQLMPTDQIPRPTREQLDDIDAALRDGLSGALFDLGVSSPQLDRPERGFSFRNDGPLDMRMDTRRPRTAAALLASIEESALAEALADLADEPNSQRIAAAIVSAHAAAPITTTAALAEIVLAACGTTAETWKAHARENPNDPHPAARAFQALRILVNDELGGLERLLRGLPWCLRPGGRVGILSFHSGEDRRVKKAFRDGLKAGLYEAIADDVIRASPAEIGGNPRAAPAKFRWARRSRA